jgi:HEAT repeat protein
VLDAAERDEACGVADQLLGAATWLHPTVLEERLRGTKSSQRALILRMLARAPALLPAHIVLDEVARAIALDSEPVLSAALEVLACTNDERCFRLLVNRFSALPSAVRQSAVLVLGEMAQVHRDVAHSLIDSGPYRGEQWIVISTVLAALARAGEATRPEDMEVLTSCLLADEASVRCAALDALADIGEIASADAIDFLLADEEPEVRLAAVRALGRLRRESDPTPVVGRLIELAQRTDDTELLAAALEAIGDTSDPRVLAVLRPLLGRSTEASVAVAAVEAIGRVSDSRKLEALIDGLAHPDVDVAKAAMRLLAKEDDARVEAHLGAFLDHDAWGVRRLAADLLGQRGGEIAAGLLQAKRATEREPLVREALERALGVLEGTQPSRRSTPAPRQGSWRPR